MARIKIFDVDPDAQKREAADDIVGRFRSGAQVQNRPMALTEWRITTGDPGIADAVSRLFGGEPQGWETTTDETIEVYTEAPEISVILDGPNAVKTSMVLWGRKGKIRECDGVTQKDGTACVCPQTVKERKAAAEKGEGCDPSTMIFFRLADAPDLGRFRFISGSWSLLQEVGRAQDALEEIGGPAMAVLKLEQVQYETSTGQKREFTKPVLKVTGAAPKVEQ